ncbi:hypothetical protein OAI58_09200 [Amylibacter sp.]|nr:hypothetical protein [Amylibacter sp.]
MDFGGKVGFGHLSRCIALAEKLFSHNIEVWIISCNNSINIRSMISQKIRHRIFAKSADLNRIIHEISPDIFIVDLLEKYSSATEKIMIKQFVLSSKVTICFDNYFSEEIPFDFFIGPKFFSDTETQNRFEGLQYILFRDTFLAQRKISRFINQNSSVLISLGNVDPFNISHNLVTLLIELFDSSELHVIIGSGFSEWNKKCLLELEKKFDKVNTVSNETDLSGYFGSCDISFVSGGQSKFEASLLGSYPIIIANSDEEIAAGSIYHDQELGTFLGDARDFNSIAVSQKISFVLDNPEMVMQRRRTSFQKLDGCGSERIVQKLLKLCEKRRKM